MNSMEREVQDRINRLAKQLTESEKLLRKTESDLLPMRAAVEDLRASRAETKKKRPSEHGKRYICRGFGREAAPLNRQVACTHSEAASAVGI